MLSCPADPFTEDLAIEKKLEKKKRKKNKKKRSEHTESNEEKHNDSIFCEEEPSLCKKRRKVVCMDTVQYKPGMLTDLLQRKKYGCLILPWEASFGKEQSSGRLISEEGETEMKKNIKINPLFDMSTRSDGNVKTRSSITYSVFVGNLPQEITINQIKKIFKKLGNTISKIKIRGGEIKKNQMFVGGKPNVSTNDEYKHALVKFNSQESYEAALHMNGKLYKGHHLRITGAKCETSSDPEKSVFVGNLAFGVSDDDLWKTFETCGEIESVRIIRDKLSKKGNFGYVNFKSAESVNEALKLDSKSLFNREIRVSQINRNIGSLSNSIVVKRKKKKQKKSNHNASGNEIESNSSAKTCEESQKITRKSSKNKITRELEQGIKIEIPKKKKKKPTDGADEQGFPKC